MFDDANLLMAGRPQPIAFRSSTTGGNAATVGRPTGTASGDLVVVVANDGTRTLTAGGGTFSRSAVGNTGLFWKIMVTADLSGDWSWDSGGGVYSVAACYSPNGITIASATVRRTGVTASSASTTLTLAGYSGAKPRGIISACIDDQQATIPATPAGFTSRVSAGGFGRRIADDLNNYPGSDVVWTGIDAGAGNASAWLLEVL